jgi:hypothetical protein
MQPGSDRSRGVTEPPGTAVALPVGARDFKPAALEYLFMMPPIKGCTQTGSRDYAMAKTCYSALVRLAEQASNLTVFHDGTLTPAQCAELKQENGIVDVLNVRDFEAAIDDRLKGHPRARDFCWRHPNNVKLLVVPALFGFPFRYFDSDILSRGSPTSSSRISALSKGNVCRLFRKVLEAQTSGAARMPSRPIVDSSNPEKSYSLDLAGVVSFRQSSSSFLWSSRRSGR